MVEKKSWQEFRGTGLLLIINQVLHIFGWAVVCEVEEDGTVSSAYPARVRFRGFSNEDTSEAYRKVSVYLKANADQLAKEADDGA